MTAVKDLTGQNFGAWNVIHRASSSKAGKARWLCVCTQCGIEKEVVSGNLVSGRSTRCKSCGSRKPLELGDNIYSWTVVKSDYYEDGAWMVGLQCVCGEVRFLKKDQVYSGNSTSCGCSMYNEVPTAGRRFGRLTVSSVKATKSGRGKIIKCVCDCGAGPKRYKWANLMHGYAQSCGCYRSEVTAARNYKHGLSHTKPYKRAMVAAYFIRRRKGGGFTVDEVLKLRKKQRNRCAICGEKLGDGYHHDHTMPTILGGDNVIQNIQLTCSTCNLSKGGKHPIDFMQSRGYLL